MEEFAAAATKPGSKREENSGDSANCGNLMPSQVAIP